MRHTVASLALLALLLAPLAVRLARAEEGEDFTGEDVSKRSFVGKNLEHAVFEAATATEADFSRARLAGANFRGTALDDARFSETDLTGADLRETKLRWTNFGDADLSQANLEGADLSKAHVRRTRFCGANLRNLAGIGSCEQADFRGADVRGANLTGFENGGGVPTKWRGAKYDKATKWPKGFDPDEVEAVLYVGDQPKRPQSDGTRPDHPIPEGRDFRGEDLTKRKFADRDLSGASLWNVDAIEAVFERVRLVGADLSGVDLSAAQITDCDLTGADLRRAWLRWPTLRRCDLSKADLRGVDLSQTHLYECRFASADLRDLKGLGTVKSGDFSGADLRGANLSSFRDDGSPPHTVFTGATYDKWTRWPDGFDPEAAGAVQAR